MSVDDTYGSSVHSAAELAHIVGERLGAVFVVRDSYYPGVYYLGEAPPYDVQVQPNAVPGDDD